VGESAAEVMAGFQLKATSGTAKPDEQLAAFLKNAKRQREHREK
jgi:hypothetical protein